MMGILGLAFMAASPATGNEADSLSFTTFDNGAAVVSSEGLSVTVLESDLPVPTGESLAALAKNFTCDLDVQNPHGSTHVKGTINVVAKVTCAIPAGEISLGTSLSRRSPNYKQWFANDVTTVGKRTAQNNRAVSCTEGPGQFRGWASATLTPPPGYKLVGPATFSTYGNTVSIPPCGASRIATGGSSSTVTVEFVRIDLVDQ